MKVSFQPSAFSIITIERGAVVNQETIDNRLGMLTIEGDDVAEQQSLLCQARSKQALLLQIFNFRDEFVKTVIVF